MANGTVRVPQPTADPNDARIDNEQLTVGGQTVQRQRVVPVPVAASVIAAGVSGSVAVPSTHALVALSAYGGAQSSSVEIGAVTVPLPAGAAFSDSLSDAPIPGPLTVTFTGTVSYYVRTVERVA